MATFTNVMLNAFNLALPLQGLLLRRSLAVGL
jgi:hypothetical protein